MITTGTVGGILLIVGAIFTLRGNILYAVGAYFLADICWIIMSYQRGDMVGFSLTTIGMVLGLWAFIKMQSGRMHKSLKKDRH